MGSGMRHSRSRIDRGLRERIRWPASRGPISSADAIQKKFAAALDELIAQVRRDRSILAAILCGSLSHDAVWEKSDIDLALVTIDDKKLDRSGVALYADGVNVHAFLMPRAEFRKTVEGRSAQFVHALDAGQGAPAVHAR